MSMALTISLVGLAVVFLGLGGLSFLIFLNSKNSKTPRKTYKKDIKTATEDEVAVISLAIYLTKLFNETQASEFRVKHKTISPWVLKSLLNKRFKR